MSANRTRIHLLLTSSKFQNFLRFIIDFDDNFAQYSSLSETRYD